MWCLTESLQVFYISPSDVELVPVPEEGERQAILWLIRHGKYYLIVQDG